MKTLPTEFTKSGFTHRQVQRTGNVAIFERQAIKRLVGPVHSRSHFEVIRILNQPAYSRFGNQYPATEAYPPSTQWGRFGFTCHDLSSAQARVATLIPFDHQNAGNIAL